MYFKIAILVGVVILILWMLPLWRGSSSEGFQVAPNMCGFLLNQKAGYQSQIDGATNLGTIATYKKMLEAVNESISASGCSGNETVAGPMTALPEAGPKMITVLPKVDPEIIQQSLKNVSVIDSTPPEPIPEGIQLPEPESKDAPSRPE
jgi:hypothetical protein